jgi:hypothetical protein
MGVNKQWRNSLLAAAKALRADAVKGRIWGPDADSSSPLFPLFSPSPPSPGDASHFYMQANASGDSILSSPERMSEAGLDEAERAERRRIRREGRVSRIVQSLENRRSGSSDVGSDADSLYEERSVPPSPSEVLVAGPVSSSSSQPREDVDDEPSMEELLAGAESGPWGARAWEEMDAAPGATVKHIISPGAEVELADTGGMDTIVPSGSGSGSGKSKGSGGLGSKGSKGKSRDDRRVVTAIFSPDSQDQTGEDVPVLKENKNDERVQHLQAELESSRDLVEAFRRRLELVEARIASVEEGDDARLKELEVKLEAERLAKEEAVTRARQAEEALASERGERERSAAEYSVKEQEWEREREEQRKRAASVTSRELQLKRGRALAGKLRDDYQLPSISQLPSYVLLVGFGVCVVALRVVFRRMVMAGRGSR